MDARRPNAAYTGRVGSGARSAFLPVRLAPGVHMCRAGGRVIFLDLAQDEYSALDDEQTRSFDALIRAEQGIHGAAQTSEAGARLLALLSDAGIIADVPGAGRAPCPPSLTPPTKSAPQRMVGPTPPLAVVRAMLACVRASIDLKRPLIDIVAAVARRKQRGGERRQQIPAMEMARASFQTARLFYPRPYLCLFDSLSLLHHFASFGIFPDWVFGVRATPFEAHCWVQHGDVAINEAAEVAASYTPILVV